MDNIGRPELKIIAWNGNAVYGNDKKNIPVVTLCDRASLLRLILDPEMNFGDLYSNRRIRFEGDLAGFLIDTFVRMSDYGTGNKLRRIFKGALHHTIGNTLSRAIRWSKQVVAGAAWPDL
jgi:cyclopropane-fatty-acyl-phospholipid synthase